MTDRRDRWGRHGFDPDEMERVQVDPDLLESQLRIARMMSFGPLTDEPGA